MHAKNGTVILPDGTMDYIRFGSGRRNLVMLPGLGESLQSVKGTALPIAWMYRIFSKEFTVWMFSRKVPLREGCTTRDMAADQAQAMDLLGIGQADVVGVSMGGMIAQWLTADYPEKVNKLVLTVTAPEPNPLLTESVEEWVGCARRGDNGAFMDSNLRRIYSEAYYRRNKWITPIVGKLTKPKSYERFYIQASACMNHDAGADLSRIKAPTLVVGGERDLALGGEASVVLADAIPGAKLHMYPQWGHGLYEEEKGFNRLVLDFLLEKK